MSWGGTKADQYRINTETGERTLIEKSVTRTMGISPDSRWFLYLKDKHVRAYNLETGKVSDLDDGEKITTPYDDCFLMFPTTRPRVGETAVRLGRIRAL